MTRPQITEFLSKLTISTKLSGIGKYYAREVTIDYGHGKGKEKRVDFMQFTPDNQLCASGIEHGYFTCYEIKSCKADLISGHGLNFIGEKNYLVMTMDTYKECIDILNDHFKIPWHVGILVAVPFSEKAVDEFEHPTPVDEETYALSQFWKLDTIRNSHKTYRERSISELLFCMLRAGR